MCFTAIAGFMATYGAAIAGAAAVAGTAATLYSSNMARKAQKNALDAQRNMQLKAKSDQLAAETEAAGSANARVAARRRALRNQSLMTGGGLDAGPSGVLSGGRPTLGG